MAYTETEPSKDIKKIELSPCQLLQCVQSVRRRGKYECMYVCIYELEGELRIGKIKDINKERDDRVYQVLEGGILRLRPGKVFPIIIEYRDLKLTLLLTLFYFLLFSSLYLD